jgi:hypothetical protein
MSGPKAPDAHAPELIPQAHGGALMPAWPKSTSGNAVGWRRAKALAFNAMKDGTEDGVRKLMELVRSDDDRVAMVAVKELLDRTLGKPTDLPQVNDDALPPIDLSALSDEDRGELAAAMAVIRRLTNIGRVIEGGLE